MESTVIIEAIGYIGSALVLVSMLMTSVVKLRTINCIGSLIFTGYAMAIHSYPTAAMNFSLALINIYNLIRLFKGKKEYSVIKLQATNTLIRYFLDLYENDIKKYFPETDKNAFYNCAYLVCHGTDAVGVLLGTMDSGHVINVKIDYTTPVYRDCSVGKYLYKYLAGQNVEELVVEKASEIHGQYLSKMGFVSLNGCFVKKL